MKISKIASLAILGISLSTSAFADFNGDYNTFKNSKYVEAKSALDIFFDSIDFISSPENAKLLKTFTTDLDSNTAIKAAFEAIANIPLNGSLTSKALEPIEVDANGKKAKLVIEKDTDKPKLTLTVGDQSDVEIITDNEVKVNGKNWDKVFAADNKAVLEKLIKETKKVLESKVEGFRTAAITKSEDLANDLATADQTVDADKAEYIAANIDILKAAFDEKFKNLTDAKDKEKKEKKFVENITKASVMNAVVHKLTETTNGAIDEFIEKAKVIEGIDATGFDVTKLKLEDKSKSEKILEVGKRAQKIFDKIKSVQTLNSQLANAEAMKNATETEKAEKKKAQFAVMKKAAELGIKFSSKAASGTEITSKNVNDYAPANESAFTEAYAEAKKAIEDQVKKQAKTIANAEAEAIEVIQWFDAYSNLKAAKADLISDYLIAGADNKAIAKAISGAVSNKALSEILTELDLDKTQDAIKSLTTSVKEVSDVIANNSVIDGVSFANNQATATRLAKLSNPFNDDLALAYAIKNIKNDSFADNSGDLVNSTIKAYTDRYNNDNNVWGTLIGAKGRIKDAGNPEFYGLSLGYDKRLDNTILGGFVSYAKSKLDTKLVSSDANNYQLGAYSRTFIDNHEIDVKASFALAKNSLDRTSKSKDPAEQAKDKYYKQKANFDSYLFNLKADYGYVVDIDDALFLKPTVGLEYSYAKNKGFKETGDIPFNYHGYNSSTLALNAALEIRQYVNNSNFLYFTPGVSTQLYKTSKDLVVNIVGSNVNTPLPTNNSKQTFFTLNTGADIKLTDALSTNINFGVKASSKEQYYNGTLGLKYQF